MKPLVLVIHDSPTFRHEVGGVLAGAGYAVSYAPTGEEGLALAATLRPNALVVDGELPGIDGTTVIRRIRSDVALRNTPCLLLTATDDADDELRSLEAGADAYITKSADFEILKARLRATLRRTHFEDEQRQIREDALRHESEARYQRLLHSSMIGVVQIADTGVVVDANDAFLRLIGHGRNALERGELRWDVLVAPASRDSAAAAAAAAAAETRDDGSATPREIELVRRDEMLIPVRYGTVPLDGTSTAVGFVVDRTEERQAEQRLQAYTVMLEQRNRELVRAHEQVEQESLFKSRFLANMSHELRTPLNAIIGFSELMSHGLAGALSAQQGEYLGHVVTAGHHLLELVNDVLDLSRVATGRMELSPVPGSVRAVLDEAQKMAEALLVARAQRLVIIAPPSLPEVRFDRLRVRQVIYNYLSNAIKFSPPGGQIELSIEHRGDQVWVACRDHGRGIAPEDLPRLFREFERVGDKTGTEGTGLGLALSRQLIELHGGMVGVESVAGVGSTFSFTLPVAGPGGHRPGHATILVVDADPHAAERVCGHVRAAGCTAAVARDREEALRLARQLSPVAITLGGGTEAAELRDTLGAETGTRTIPVIDVEPVAGRGDSRVAFLDALRSAGVAITGA